MHGEQRRARCAGECVTKRRSGAGNTVVERAGFPERFAWSDARAVATRAVGRTILGGSGYHGRGGRRATPRPPRDGWVRSSPHRPGVRVRMTRLRPARCSSHDDFAPFPHRRASGRRVLRPCVRDPLDLDDASDDRGPRQPRGDPLLRWRLRPFHCRGDCDPIHGHVGPGMASRRVAPAPVVALVRGRDRVSRSPGRRCERRVRFCRARASISASSVSVPRHSSRCCCTACCSTGGRRRWAGAGSRCRGCSSVSRR